MRLRQLGEFGLIERIRKATPPGPGVRLGIGDDAAWVECPKRSLLITADLLLEGVHFNLRWTSFYGLILSLGIPVDFKVEDVEQFYRGIRALASDTGVALIGGDMSAAKRFLISATLVGYAPYGAVRRSGGRIGDDLYVTGTLGDSALGLELLKRKRQKAKRRGIAHLLSRHHFPTARLKAGTLLARERLAKAMIDVSDGLLQDLGHICKASGVGAVVWQDALPLSPAYRNWAGSKGSFYALTGGEDYELLFCLRRRDRARLGKIQKKLGVPIARIGECVPPGEGIKVVNGRGEPVSVPVGGHDHFKPGS